MNKKAELQQVAEAVLLTGILDSDEAEESDQAVVAVRLARATLQRRRWRARAEDGTEVAAALPRSAEDGGLLTGDHGTRFRIVQEPERVVAIPLPDSSELSAKIAWYLGNRHIPIEVRSGEILVEEFPNLVASLDRIGIRHTTRTDVLRCRAHSAGHRH